MCLYTEPLAKDLTQKRKYQPHVRADIFPTAGLKGDEEGCMFRKETPSVVRTGVPRLVIFVRLFDCEQQKPILANAGKHGFIGRAPSVFKN